MGFFSKIELDQVNPKLTLAPLCGVCGLLKGCQSPKMAPSGGGKLKVMILGEFNDERSDSKHKHAVGEFGKLLRSVLSELDEIGNVDEDVYFHNALSCRPKNDRFENTPSRYVDYCRPLVLKAIRELKPYVIVPLGFLATKSLIDYTFRDGEIQRPEDISKWVGWQIPDQKLNTWIAPTYSPDFLMKSRRNGQDDPILRMYFKEHLRAAFALRKSRPFDKVPNYVDQVEILDDKDVPKAVEYFRTEPQDGLVAWDYETNGLKPDSNHAWIRCVSMSDGKRTVAFDLNKNTIDCFKEFLVSDCWKIASNLIFEDRWTRKLLGVKVKNWLLDTMIAAHVLDNRGGISSIKFQAYVLLGQPDYATHLDEFIKTPPGSGGYVRNKINRADRRDILKYCGLDSLLELLVARKQMSALGFGGGIQ